jgi:thiol-disulfide isomerase/thioredoxin
MGQLIHGESTTMMSKLFLYILLMVSSPVSAQLIAKMEPGPLSKLKDYKGKSYSLKPAGKAVAYVFLSTDCPLCKNYAPVLEALQEKYLDIQFFGIVSGVTFTRTDVATYAIEYGITFPVLMDPLKRAAIGMNATTTPQVILVDANGKEFYRGLIDNWVVSLGKQRKVATKKYLEDAIKSLQAGGQPIPATTPVGCLISNF